MKIKLTTIREFPSDRAREWLFFYKKECGYPIDINMKKGDRKEWSSAEDDPTIGRFGSTSATTTFEIIEE